MASNEKSEGELTDSGEEEPNPPPPKRLKSGVSNGQDCYGPCPELLMATKAERRREKKRLKKLRKREAQQRYSNTNNIIIVASGQYLDSSQALLLSRLASLLHATGAETDNIHSPPSPSSDSLSPSTTDVSLTIKTGKLQGVLTHLLLGVPQVKQQVSGVEYLRSHRVAVLWLSMVSAQLFLSSPELFTGLKSLSPCLQFLVQHPGSTRYAKLGLESFLSVNVTESQGRKGKREDKGEATAGVTRAECLLDVDDMDRNDFPLPPHLQGPVALDVSGYLELCREWPARADETGVQWETNSYPMFAVDCEMVETKAGFELARVSVVDETMECVYDKLVKPENPVLDYKTKYSGVTEEILRDVTTTLADVHGDLTSLLPPRCILIGHSLENDLLALKMLHPFVIDTACLFPCSTSLSHKPKLQLLAKRLLGLEIQVGERGHSSRQDASACMQLVRKKLCCGDSMALVHKEQSLLTEIALSDRSVAIVDRASLVNLFGAKTHKYRVSHDEEVVEVAEETIPRHDLTFLQLHSYEYYLKSSSSGHIEQQEESQRDTEQQEETRRILRQLDSEAVDIVSRCPGETLVMVVCGSSDIRQVKSLQSDTDKLREVVGVARTGLALAYIVR